MKQQEFELPTPFEKKLYLASPNMHGEELSYIRQAFETNWVSTLGENINEVEAQLARRLGRSHAVATSSGTAALHLAVRACAVRLYGEPDPVGGSLAGKRVFCSDLTFAATVNPVLYEGGEPIFIDSEYETWNMDPAALERAFALYPDVKLVILVHLYGTPAKLKEICEICRRHGALLVEDAAESLGAVYDGSPTGSFGDVSVISFNGNKIITGSSGGMVLCDDPNYEASVRKWSTQSREPVAWYQHRELGYNYRMSNLIAGVVRGQLPWLEDHMERKRQIYERYRQALRGLPVSPNPYERTRAVPNHWLSCLLIDREAMCSQTRTADRALYTPEAGKSCPTQILEAIASLNAEGRPVWKPMHLQPLYQPFPFVAAEEGLDVGSDLFARGLCLPSDIRMTEEQQRVVAAAVRACFD
ncbi:MAG: aminotransferase class I/II-fold pyridoxal phosphate-dependent enzyme [Oscillospiraceae bacterium]|nr:aminotransferase class I/II-fold pyridoxal phosphate-dependent enzyme [Oscillospiraceae bacterium]